MWVDPRDIANKPGLWRVVDDVVSISPDVDTVIALAQESLHAAVR
jgi:hypothetical protein